MTLKMQFACVLILASILLLADASNRHKKTKGIIATRAGRRAATKRRTSNNDGCMIY
jgi:hypothetical protein